MEEKISFELRREAFHICLGISIMLLIFLLKEKAIWLLFFALIGGIALSLLSLRFKLPIIHYMLLRFERPQYLHKFPGKGMLFFVAGCLLVLKLFSANLSIVFASIAILICGDSVSHLIGLGKRRIKRKIAKRGIGGTIAGIAAASAAAMFFVKPLYAFTAALIAMLVENVSLRVGLEEVDDNVTVPLVAGTVIFLLLKLL